MARGGGEKDYRGKESVKGGAASSQAHGPQLLRKEMNYLRFEGVKKSDRTPGFVQADTNKGGANDSIATSEEPHDPCQGPPSTWQRPGGAKDDLTGSRQGCFGVGAPPPATKSDEVLLPPALPEIG